LKRTRTYNPDVVDENILILFLTWSDKKKGIDHGHYDVEKFMEWRDELFSFPQYVRSFLSKDLEYQKISQDDYNLYIEKCQEIVDVINAYVIRVPEVK
jgi:hypothetical protein